MTSKLIDYKYNKILKDVDNLSKQYFYHLISAFESTLLGAQPGSQPDGWVSYHSPDHLRNRAFHIQFANEIVDYKHDIFKNLNIRVDDLEHKSLSLQRAIILEMRSSLYSTESLDNLFKDDSTHPLKEALEFIVDYYSKYDGPNLKNVLNKLKNFFELQRILMDDSGIESKIDNPKLNKLIKYKDALNKCNSLDERRHLAWDVFFTMVSVILLPIALARCAYNLKVNGTWHFMWSDGKKFKEKINAKIEKAEQLEAKVNQEPSIEKTDESIVLPNDSEDIDTPKKLSI